jgi:uncharacterized membrane protein
VHILWSNAAVAIGPVLLGLVCILARKPFARLGVYRQSVYSDNLMRAILGIATKPVYYVVFGILFIVAGLVLGLGLLEH